MTIRIDKVLAVVTEGDVRRVSRNTIGDWCAEVTVYGRIRVAVFDYHPTIAMMRALRDAVADITDEVIAQGAKGMPIRWHAAGWPAWPRRRGGAGARRSDTAQPDGYNAGMTERDYIVVAVSGLDKRADREPGD